MLEALGFVASLGGAGVLNCQRALQCPAALRSVCRLTAHVRARFVRIIRAHVRSRNMRDRERSQLRGSYVRVWIRAMPFEVYSGLTIFFDGRT